MGTGLVLSTVDQHGCSSPGGPSNNLIAAAWQSITIEWWEKRKTHFDIFVSELVYEEATRGDPSAVSKRIEVMNGIPYLKITNEAVNLAKMIIKPGPLPKKASNDALHLAIAAVHKIDYLMTFHIMWKQFL
jgi:predicted nucleic acid-binding protein